MRLTGDELFDKLAEVLRKQPGDGQLADLLDEVQPFDIAGALEQVSEMDGLRILQALPPAMAAEALEHLDFVDQYSLFDHLPAETARRIAAEISSDAIADLIGAIHPKQAEQVLKLLPPDEQGAVRILAEYPENSAGGRMTVDYISVRQQMTADRVLAHIRKVGRAAETVSYIYVVDAAGRLTGVASLKEVILADPQAKVAGFMNHQVVSVPATMDQEEVAEIVSDYDLVAVPVVSADNRLLGIITVDDVIDVLQQEASEDVYQLAGTAVPEETGDMPFLHSVWALARPRLPWLVGLLFLELGSGLIVGRFSGSITPAMAALLAMFTVVMAGESGNAATQSLAVIVRGLATGEIEERELPRVVLREALVGVVVGLTVGSVLAVTAWAWLGSLRFGLAVGGALATNLLIAKVLGGLFPVIIHRLGIDPAVASGPFITTLTDNSSMFIYYGMAFLVLGGSL